MHSGDLKGVSLGSRAASFIVDLLIVTVFVALFLVPLKDAPGMRLIAGLGAFLFLWGYFAVLESSKYQATLGKLLFGLKVVDLAGRPITLAQATGRHFSRKIAFCVFFGLGTLAVSWTLRKQALHDWSSQTLVVKEARRSAGNELTPAA